MLSNDEELPDLKSQRFDEVDLALHGGAPLILLGNGRDRCFRSIGRVLAIAVAHNAAPCQTVNKQAPYK